MLLLCFCCSLGAVCWMNLHMPQPVQLLPSLFPISQYRTTNIHSTVLAKQHQHSCRSAHLQHTVAYPEGSTTRMKLWPRDSENTCTINKHRILAQQRCLVSFSPKIVKQFHHFIDIIPHLSSRCNHATMPQMQCHSQWPAICRRAYSSAQL
jgi:hypothetical protein